MPFVIMAGLGAVAGGVSSIMGGKAEAAAIRAQNEQATKNYIRANTQKTFNNARDQFQNAYQATQQLKKNNAIYEAAMQSDLENKANLQSRTTFQQGQLSKQLMAQKSSLINSVANKGMSSGSGSYGALATAQALDAVQNAMQIKKNAALELSTINKQTQGMLSQQTQNIFMPNTELYDDAPLLGDAGAAESAGMMSGLLQIGGGIAGMGMGMGGSPSSGGGGNVGGAGSSTSSGIYGGGGYQSTSTSAPLGIGPH